MCPLSPSRRSQARLQERYFTDVGKYARLAGIRGDSGEAKAAQDGNCWICFEDVKADDTASLACGHGPFCRECYADYLHEKVSNNGALGIMATTCMQQNCPLRLSPLHWKKLARCSSRVPLCPLTPP